MTDTSATHDWTAHFAERTTRVRRSEVRELLKLLERPEIISFAGGVPEPSLFPVKELEDAYRAVLENQALVGRALQYGTSEGWTPLREKIAAQMTERGVRCDVENVMITGGAQQAIEFSARVFVDKGDEMLVQAPTFLGALQAFGVYGPRYTALPEPGQNAAFERGGRSRPPAMAYVMADFQNPTGQTLSVAEREEVVALCRDLDTPIIEDNPYGELWYDREPLPSIAAIDLDGRPVDAGRTIYCGTVSKTLAPALRVGWAVAPRQIIDRMVMLKQAADIQVSTINQVVVSELFDRLPADRLDKVRATYRARRDAMLASLERHMPDGVEWTRPDGGLFVWAELPQGADASKILEKAVEHGVAYVPGVAFFHDRSGANTLRLSFSLADPDKIETGVARLGELFRASV